jgi:Flp pilus assembly protein TadB
MSLFLVAFVVMACWFVLSCAVVVLLYACCLHVDARKRRALERNELRVPDFIPESWELSVTERRVSR